MRINPALRFVFCFVLRTIEVRGRTARRLTQTAVLTVASAALLSAAFGQTPRLSIPLSISDPMAAARCLAGGGCGRSVVAACVAEQTIKAVPPALKAEALALARSKPAEDCRDAIAALALDRQHIEDIYHRPPRAPLPEEFAQSLRNYFGACLASPRMALNHGKVSPAQRHFLGDHTGVIVRRNNPAWSGPQPICQAARLGRFLVTAESCIPAYLKASLRPGDYVPDLGFRFLFSPTIYGVSLHRLGTDKDAAVNQGHAYAIFDISDGPSLDLDEDIAPLLGKMRPLDDLVVVTAHIVGVLNRGIRSGAAMDLDPIATIHNNTLCRPGYVSPDGVFLHSCLIDSALSAGAPMFQRQNGRYVFVGIHVGDTITLKQPSLAACARGLNKYGIAIPPSVLRGFISN